MAKYRKLGRNSSQRKALLRGQVTALIENGKIVTTEARAKEVKKQAEKLITLAIKEKDNFETVKVSAKVPKKDANGKRVKEVVDGKHKDNTNGALFFNSLHRKPKGTVCTVRIGGHSFYKPVK